MSLFNRRKFLISTFALAALSACGFEPTYKKGSSASQLKGQLALKSGKGRELFEMRERLVERFGFAQTPKYTLFFTYVSDSDGLAVSDTVQITRFNIKGSSKFSVTETETGKVLYAGEVFSVTAYSSTSQTYSTRIAEQDAESRLALALADKIETRISSTASQWIE